MLFEGCKAERMLEEFGLKEVVMRFEQVSNQTMSILHRQIIDAEALLMVSQCSSANSVAAYVPALYVCLLAAERLHLHPIARPFAAGSLLSLYALPYLAQGATQQWWTYTPAAAAGEAALPLRGSQMWTLAGGWNSSVLVPSAATSALLETR